MHLQHKVHHELLSHHKASIRARALPIILAPIRLQPLVLLYSKFSEQVEVRAAGVLNHKPNPRGVQDGT
jgi:hypothetical protein